MKIYDISRQNFFLFYHHYQAVLSFVLLLSPQFHFVMANEG